MKRFAVLLSILLCLFTIACSTNKNTTQIVTTTLPIYEFTNELCKGTDITVTRLITEEISCVHDYTLNVNQLSAVESADLVICNGLGLDAFVEDILPEGKEVLSINETPEDIKFHHEHHHDHSKCDPHIWLDPHSAKEMCQTIYEDLSLRYPEHQETFAKNQDLLNQMLDNLEDYGKKQLSQLSSREIITFHDGFLSLANAFDLTILCAIEEESGSEASASQLKNLVTIIQEHQIKVIFVEKNGSCSAASIIARETGAKIYKLDMAISGDSYFDAMYHNIDTLKEALG